MTRAPRESRWLLLLAVFMASSAHAQLAPRQLALAYQDSILRIAVARQTLTSAAAEAERKTFTAALAPAPSANDVHDLRARLDRDFGAWLDAIGQQAETSQTWPRGRPATDWRPLAQMKLGEVREEALTTLIEDRDPLPLLEKAAQIAGWTVGQDGAGVSTGRQDSTGTGVAGRVAPATGTDRTDVAVANDSNAARSTTSATRETPAELGPPPMDAFWAAVDRDGDRPEDEPPQLGEKGDGLGRTITARSDDGEELVFTLQGDTTGTGFTESDADVSIHIVSGTWGGNCPGAKAVDDTGPLADDCAGYIGSCERMIDTATFPDPAPGCKKAYIAEWHCGTDKTPRRAIAHPRPELSPSPSDLFVRLECPE